MGRRVKTLVICVDRDNDIGEKAGLEAPIIGREASLSAATRLALADSEDSDINAIFEAIRIYERLNAGGEEAEVVLVAGDKNVGIASDRKIGEELDGVLTRTGAGSVILVSDGAEDEWIIPLIQSRVRIDSVRRVVVRQSEPLESTFYVVKKLFEDPKFARTFLLPIGLLLFMIALSLLFGVSKLVMGLVLGFIGVYMLLKGLGRENYMITFFENVKQSLYSGKISFVTYICAIVLLLAGSFQGIMEIPPEENDGVLVDVMYYLKGAIWWYIGAALAPLVGKMMNMLIEGEKIVRHWAILFSVIASGLVLWGGSNCIIWLNEGEFARGYLYLFFSILGALVISFIGVKISWYMRSTISKEVETGDSG